VTVQQQDTVAASVSRERGGQAEPGTPSPFASVEGRLSRLGSPPLVPFLTPRRFGTFIARLNRFAALVDLDGEQAIAHLPNTGRMTELLVPGHPVMLIERGDSPASAQARVPFDPAQDKPVLHRRRKTAYDMVLVQYEGHWVSVDSRLPSQMIYEALVAGALPAWVGCTRVRREAVWGESRLDLELWRGGRRCLIETKSVNLVVDGRALFPDAPTLRGAKHLRSLMAASAEGLDASVVFVIQRPDALCFSPFDEADPEFGRTLREAAHTGVGVYAYRCAVSPDGMALEAAVPVEL